MQIIITSDGSPTLFSAQYGVTYHSLHGAVTESKHVYIDAGLRFLAAEKREISLLEMGFGTGLNAWLAFIEAAKRNLQIQYEAIEAYPLAVEEIDRMQFSGQLFESESGYFISDLHRIPMDKWLNLQPNFSLKKRNERLETIELQGPYDLVFFDAFAPQIQPELWKLPILQKIYDSMNREGILTTYCAQGQFKRDLKRCGFKIDVLKGPPGKREMIRAYKI